MRNYYLHNGTEQQGPYTFQDLKNRNIKKDTQIWYEGLTEWTTAGQVYELKGLFITPPPLSHSPLQQPTSFQAPKEKSPARQAAIIVLSIVLVVILGIMLSNFIGALNRSSGDSSYQAKVMTVEEIEISSPTQFLTADGKYRENFWGDKIKVFCTITNKATVATYKDAIIRVTYYSKSKTVLGTRDYTVYEVLPPNSVKNVELKIDNYKDVQSIGWEVIHAVPFQ